MTNSTRGTELTTLLHDDIEDEKQGAHASLGFTYQQWWISFRACELLLTEKDFAIAIEFKEDAAVLDSPTTPSSIKFFQIKKNDRNTRWTINELLKRKKTSRKDNKTASNDPPKGPEGHSILGKLYRKKITFIDHNVELAFASNAAFEIINDDGSNITKKNVSCDSLTPKQKAHIQKELGTELGIDADKIELTGIWLERSPLPLEQQDLMVSGKLEAINDAGVLPFRVSRLKLSALAIAAKVQEKSIDTEFCLSFEELRKRIISRREIVQILQNVEGMKNTTEELFSRAVDRLTFEGYPFLDIEDILEERVAVCTHATDKTNTLYWETFDLIVSEYEEIDILPSGLSEIISILLDRVRNRDPERLSTLGKGYISGVCIMAISHAHRKRKSDPPPSKESEEQE